MIVNIEEVKQNLRIDTNEEDASLQVMINAAEEFVKSSIDNKEIDATNNKAKMVCLFLIADMYDQRGFVTEKGNSKVRDIAKMMLLQL